MKMDKAKLKSTLLDFIVPIVCLGTSLLLFLLVIYPSFRKIPELKEKLTTQQNSKTLLTDKLNKLNRFIDFKAILEENSNLVNRVMPADQNVPGLLDQVDQITKESGLDITKLSYSLSDSTTKDATKSSYSTVLISLGADGNFNEMVSFFKAIEGASRLVSVSNFRFSGVNTREENKLAFTFILSAPFLDVKSSAVTDEPLNLDLASSEFVNFINNIKGLRYFEKSGDLSNLSIKAVQEEITETDESSQSTPSAQ